MYIIYIYVYIYIYTYIIYIIYIYIYKHCLNSQTPLLGTPLAPLRLIPALAPSVVLCGGGGPGG